MTINIPMNRDSDVEKHAHQLLINEADEKEDERRKLLKQQEPQAHHAQPRIFTIHIPDRFGTRARSLRRNRCLAMLASLTLLFGVWGAWTSVVAGAPNSRRYKPVHVDAGDGNPGAAAVMRLGPDLDGKYTIASSELTLQFIPYGAALTNLFVTVPDPSSASSSSSTSTSTKTLDIVAGWDNATYYAEDKLHPYFGGVVGRYANRIKNGTFMITGEDGVERTVQVDRNEHGGVNSLHGGKTGLDSRIWDVVNQTSSSITFKLIDEDGEMGFEGVVETFVTYSVTGNYWDISMSAEAKTKVTPIMLSSHVYWNLDGFQNPNTPLVLNHTLHLPYGGKRIDTDTILIPTGKILENEKGGVNDFWSRYDVQLGESLGKSDLVGNCGLDCVGYDTCYLNSLRPETPKLKQTPKQKSKSKWWHHNPVATLSSPWSGISLSVFTDQDAFQVYDCVGMNGSAPLKKTQGIFGESAAGNTTAIGGKRVIEQYGCVVMEVQDWIDGINHPEWGRAEKQFFGPGNNTKGYELSARYVFDF